MSLEDWTEVFKLEQYRDGFRDKHHIIAFLPKKEKLMGFSLSVFIEVVKHHQSNTDTVIFHNHGDTVTAIDYNIYNKIVLNTREHFEVFVHPSSTLKNTNPLVLIFKKYFIIIAPLELSNEE